MNRYVMREGETQTEQLTEADTTRWRVPSDLRMLGQVQGSALLKPHYLLRRGDGQVVQVSELLNTVVSEMDPERSPDEVAQAVSVAYGRSLTVDGLSHLVRSRLLPLGLVEDAGDVLPEQPPRAKPVFSLSLKGTMLPARVVRPISGLLQALFWPPFIVLGLAGLVAVDVMMYRQGNLGHAVNQLIHEPVLLLALYVLLTFGAFIHENGHAAACRYGGAESGEIGFGLYLVFPAFYTDVTDSYRLSRAGRIRVDLGGLYFNVLTLIVFGVAYQLSHNGLLLLAIFIMQIEMLQQLVPAVRFDGYYVLSDIIGVPDLFARVKPVLLSLIPGRGYDPRVAELKAGARWLVIGWVLTIVPLLTFSILWLLWQLPVILSKTSDSGQIQLNQISNAWASGNVPVVVLSAISIVLLILPLLGIAIILWRIAEVLAGTVTRLLTRREDAQEEVMSNATPIRPSTAEAFSDAYMLPEGKPIATRGWQRAVYQATAHTVKPRPGAAERRVEMRNARLNTPIVGTRRVVVMSRKGGVGKTTITLALGSILATMRGDRVVAVDANPDAGNLAHRVAPLNSRTITDVLRDLDQISSYSELKQYTSQAPESRLEVLASDDDPRIGMALARSDYHRLIQLLDQYYNLILLDTGTGILDSANQGLLAETDELVLVLRPGLDGGRAAALTLDWLEEHDYRELVERAVVVINAVRPGVGAPLDPIREHFEQRCGRVVCVPWDPALETGAQTVLSALQAQTQENLMEMAAAVADNFPGTGVRR